MRIRVSLPLVLVAFFLTQIASAKHLEYVRPIEQTIPATGLNTVVLENLVGPISVQTADTNDVKIEIVVHAGGNDQEFAKTLSEQLNFKIEPIAGQLRITGMYPLDHFRDYGYPHMKLVGFHGIGFHGTDKNEYQGQTVRIRNAGNKKAVELWAEIRLGLPNTVGLTIRNIYGDVQLRGSGGASNGAFDGFTDVGDFEIHNPRWAQMKLESDYGKVYFREGFGAAKDIHLSTDFGGTFLYLEPGATGKIMARKDLGFLHNHFSDARFEREGDDHVMLLGDGKGTVVHVDMSVGSLHLERALDAPVVAQ